MKPIETAEIQGLYGPVSISERLLQKIWLRADFDHSTLRTEQGEPVCLVRSGRWNHHEGPDFLEAEVQIGDKRKHGAVEVHFWQGDWERHAHSEDENFENVVLHVVLFPPGPGDRLSERTKKIPLLVLLPYLNKDLEEYAVEDALLQMEKRDLSELAGPLSGLSRERRRSTLVAGARRRWREKRRYARHRLDLLGWETACHHSCLEVLGYRRNRAPMLGIAGRFDRSGIVTASVEELFASQEGRWKLGGIRPANQPRVRLRQYKAVCTAKVDWPELLLERGRGMTEGEELAGWREQAQIHTLKSMLAKEVLSDAIGGTRLDTLVCDAFLPLLAEETGMDHFATWFQWLAGDIPDASLQLLRLLDVTDRKEWPISNGLQQGVLQFVMDREKSGFLASPDQAVMG